MSKSRPESTLARLLHNMIMTTSESRSDVAMHAAKYLGLNPYFAWLVDVPDEQGGGWLVAVDGPCRGPSGFVAHVDPGGWILRVSPHSGWRFPPKDTPTTDVMARLIDDPIRPGLGLISNDAPTDPGRVKLRRKRS